MAMLSAKLKSSSFRQSKSVKLKSLIANVQNLYNFKHFTATRLEHSFNLHSFESGRKFKQENLACRLAHVQGGQLESIPALECNTSSSSGRIEVYPGAVQVK